jgi:hypothetical protein
MMPLRSLGFWCTLLAVLASPGPAVSGECGGKSDLYFVEKLELFPGTLDVSKDRDLWRLQAIFNCLRHCPDDPRRWAGPIATACLKTMREDPQRERIVAACIPYLGISRDTGPRRRIAHSAAATIALYGTSEVEGHDIFLLLTADRRNIDFFAVAALGDRRTLAFLQATYDSLRSADGGPVESRDRLEQLLNCLYHVPGDSAVSFARVIAAEEHDSLVVERARRVINR